MASLSIMYKTIPFPYFKRTPSGYDVFVLQLMIFKLNHLHHYRQFLLSVLIARYKYETLRFFPVFLVYLYNFIIRLVNTLGLSKIRHIDIPLSKNVLSEKKLINRLRDCDNFTTQLRDCQTNRFTST